MQRGYDPAGQLVSVTDWAQRTTRFTWTPDGQPATTSYPNGVTTSRNYSPGDDLTGITTRRGTSTLLDLTYTHTPAGLIADQTTTSPTAAGSSSYTYDPLAQLATVTSTGQTTKPTGSYTVDPAGQLTQALDTTHSYDPAGQLQRTDRTDGTSTTYGYDPRGNRTTATTTSPTGGSSTTSYAYNAADQLTTLTSPTRTGAYTYDGDGLRTTATHTSPTSPDPDAEQFVWDTSSDLPLLLADTDFTYLYGPGSSPLAQISSTGDITYLHADHQGTTRALTNNTGDVTGTASYDPHGQPLTTTGAPSRFGYAGEYTDPTGLIYLRARYYDPTTQQFLTRDPLEALTNTPYSYANNNPLTYTDPTGEFAFLIIPAAIAAWGVIEAALSTADIINTVHTVADPCATTGEKLATGGLAAAGVVLPGAGFSLLGKIGRRAKAIDAAELPGYRSFAAAKRDLGPAGPGKVYDHVVEQSQIGRSGFKPEEVHHPYNLNPVDARVNQAKANYYSSRQPFTGGSTVREWLSGQSFSEQYEFGMDVLRQIESGVLG